MPGTLYTAEWTRQLERGRSENLRASLSVISVEIVSQSHTNNFHSVTRDWAHRDLSFTTDEITIPFTLMCHNLQMQITLHSADVNISCAENKK